MGQYTTRDINSHQYALCQFYNHQTRPEGWREKVRQGTTDGIRRRCQTSSLSLSIYVCVTWPGEGMRTNKRFGLRFIIRWLWLCVYKHGFGMSTWFKQGGVRTTYSIQCTLYRRASCNCTVFMPVSRVSGERVNFNESWIKHKSQGQAADSYNNMHSGAKSLKKRGWGG